MTDLEKYLKLKKETEAANQQADKAEGMLQAQLDSLERDFDCRSIKEAKKKLKLLSKKREHAKKQYYQEMDNFEKKWQDKL